jgi:putative cell wall-binding protein
MTAAATLAAPLIGTISALVGGWLGTSAQKKADEKQIRQQKLLMAQVSQQQRMLQEQVQQAEMEKALYEASQAKRKEQYAIMGGVALVGVVVGGIFLWKAFKKRS